MRDGCTAVPNYQRKQTSDPTTHVSVHLLRVPTFFSLQSSLLLINIFLIDNQEVTAMHFFDTSMAPPLPFRNLLPRKRRKRKEGLYYKWMKVLSFFFSPLWSRCVYNVQASYPFFPLFTPSKKKKIHYERWFGRGKGVPGEHRNERPALICWGAFNYVLRTVGWLNLSLSLGLTCQGKGKEQKIIRGDGEDSSCYL